ncbi:unnamed protein product [Gemmata massiliana]|uniref:Uncharacterized protein n=1 Tax=Gemmata massiliana TaxID=1210884 RepID=A0A6P2D8H3_9BACT|nr:unnamed protein product [Gemmata massiliana]
MTPAEAVKKANMPGSHASALFMSSKRLCRSGRWLITPEEFDNWLASCKPSKVQFRRAEIRTICVSENKSTHGLLDYATCAGTSS